MIKNGIMTGDYNEEWLNKIINEAIQTVLNEEKNKEKHRKMTLDELKELDIYLVDGTKYKNTVIEKGLCNAVQKLVKDGEDASSFYCGITNDLVQRKANHESQDYHGKKIDKVYAVKCDSMNTAAKVEEYLSIVCGLSRGKTDTFANGAAGDSDFVYFYRIPR